MYAVKIFIPIIIILLSSNTIFPNWINMGEYYLLQSDNNGISQLIIPDKENFFAFVDNDRDFYKYDYDANLLLSKKLYNKAIPEFYYYLRCHDDASSYSYYFTSTQQKSDIVYTKYNFFLYSIDNDSLIFIKNLINTDYQVPCGISVEDIFFDFDIREKFGLLIYNLIYGCKIGWNFSQTKLGNVDIYNQLTDSISNIINIGYENFDYNKNANKIILNALVYDSESDSRLIYDYRLILLDLNNGTTLNISRKYINKYDPNENIDGFIPDYCKLSNFDNSFVAIKDSTIYFYSPENQYKEALDSFKVDYKIRNIIYSNDDNFLIISDDKNRINIYHIRNKRLVKSFELLDNQSADHLALTQDGKGFIAGNKNGNIKYFKVAFSELNDVSPNNLFDITNITISPNPAGEYIEIKDVRAEHALPLQDIKIFNLLGERVITTPSLRDTPSEKGNISVDVSGLPAGVYFVRVADWVGRFLKI